MSKYPAVLLAVDDRSQAEEQLLSIGVDPYGIKIMKDKAVFRIIKIKHLTPPQANIIKQELLSCGADAATSRNTITSKAKFTDIIMFATISQYKRLIKKLQFNHFDLPEIGKEIEKTLKNDNSVPPQIRFKGGILDFSKRTYIMGIVNATPDSFSDGGEYFDQKKAIERANELIKSGADIIDIGGESSRPGAKEISVKEELQRVIPVVKAISKNRKAIISVDTRKSAVAEAALRAGAQIINDISALRFDPKMAKVVAKYKAVVVLMHMQGTPDTMQNDPQYDDLVFDILGYLEHSIEIAKKAGILSHHIIVDPGFGFGKALEHNLLLLKRLKEFKTLGYPLLVGTSRKSMIGKALNVPPDKRLIGTAATNAVAILNGANIIRVHDVFEMKQVAKMVDPIIRRKA